MRGIRLREAPGAHAMPAEGAQAPGDARAQSVHQVREGDDFPFRIGVPGHDHGAHLPHLTKARRLLEKVIRGTPAGSTYHDKAQSFMTRKEL